MLRGFLTQLAVLGTGGGSICLMGRTLNQPCDSLSHHHSHPYPYPFFFGVFLFCYWFPGPLPIVLGIEPTEYIPNPFNLI